MPASPEAVHDLALQDLQRQFVQEILYRKSDGLRSQVVANGLDADRRLAIYRTKARETFALALEAAFPVLLACMGSEQFRSLAWTYQRAWPSPAGNLLHIGARLPGYLADHLRGMEDEYLCDVARLEWCVQEALVAADSSSVLDLTVLAAVPPESQGEIRFVLHPSVGLLRTDYGVFALWAAHQAGQPVEPARQVTESVLVRRLAEGVQLQRLLPLDLLWLEAVRDGATLAEATAALPAGDQDQLGALLVRWVTAGVITDFASVGRLAVQEGTGP
ncbi:MAG: DUF2063 domain-containing protein [Gammaproteobacteria bacterium]|nr:DUF2063 domain-containing protein [Gammaproteobacteria bacterium]